MANIIAVAENYAFGPIGKLLTITDKLRIFGHNITFLLFGTPYQLAKRDINNKVLCVDFSKNTLPDNIISLLIKADLLISVMDLPSINWAKKYNLPIAFVDSLFWFWTTIDERLFDIDMYFFQKSFLLNKRKMNELNTIKNLIEVPPIVDIEYLSNEKSNLLLINLGGMDAKGYIEIGNNSFYPFIIVNIILKLEILKNFKQVIFTGNERIINNLKNKYEHAISDNIKFLELNHKEFIKILSQSQLLITSPGLETTLEGFVYNVPIIFLPPQNNSQYLQLDEFRKLGIASKSIHLKDFFPDISDKLNESKEAVELVIKQVNDIEEPNIQIILIRYLNIWLSNNIWHKQQVILQRNFIRMLGGINGAIYISEKIDIYLNREQS